MITFYCSTCQKTVDFNPSEVKKCTDCSTVFGNQGMKISNYINMRTTVSGTTKIEFSTTTMNDSINYMNNN